MSIVVLLSSVDNTNIVFMGHAEYLGQQVPDEVLTPVDEYCKKNGIPVEVYRTIPDGIILYSVHGVHNIEPPDAEEWQAAIKDTDLVYLPPSILKKRLKEEFAET